MKKSAVVSVDRFREAYRKIGWVEKPSANAHYIVWRSPNDSNLWVELPSDTNAPDYDYYAEKNVRMLLFALDLPENKHSIDELISQLRAYNYKLISRIVSNTEFKSDAVPYELASILPQKNIEAFRHYFLTHKTKKRSIPIDKFQMNHTEVGSFIIPVSILVDDEKNEKLIPMMTETNLVLHDYLRAIDTLLKIPARSPFTYAEKVVGESIDSKIVRDFLGKSNSIIKTKEKYAKIIEDITISGTGSPILDFNLDKEDREFQVVELKDSETLDEEYIVEIEKLELKLDDSRVEERAAEIDVVVDNIDRNGNVKFTVTHINGSELSRVFKAYSTQLSKARLDLFAEYFKNDGSAVVKGDITKAKGKMGSIIIDSVREQREDPNTKLL